MLDYPTKTTTKCPITPKPIMYCCCTCVMADSGCLLPDLFGWLYSSQHWCCLQSSRDMWSFSLPVPWNFCTHGQHAGDFNALKKCQKFGSSSQYTSGKCILLVQTTGKICTNLKSPSSIASGINYILVQWFCILYDLISLIIEWLFW